MFQFDELWIRDTNTPRSLDWLAGRYGHHVAGWVIYGDASGSARHSDAVISNWIHIQNDKRLLNKQLLIPYANPFIADDVSLREAGEVSERKAIVGVVSESRAVGGQDREVRLSLDCSVMTAPPPPPPDVPESCPSQSLRDRQCG